MTTKAIADLLLLGYLFIGDFALDPVDSIADITGAFKGTAYVLTNPKGTTYAPIAPAGHAAALAALATIRAGHFAADRASIGY